MKLILIALLAFATPAFAHLGCGGTDGDLVSSTDGSTSIRVPEDQQAAFRKSMKDQTNTPSSPGGAITLNPKQFRDVTTNFFYNGANEDMKERIRRSHAELIGVAIAPASVSPGGAFVAN